MAAPIGFTGHDADQAIGRETLRRHSEIHFAAARPHDVSVPANAIPSTQIPVASAFHLHVKLCKEAVPSNSQAVLNRLQQLVNE